MRTVAVSAPGAALHWSIVETHSARSASGRLYRISIAGELRMRSAQTRADAARVVYACTGDVVEWADEREVHE